MVDFTSPLTRHHRMETPYYAPSLPTIEQRQERVLDIVECLEEQAHEFARDMRTMQVTLLRLFELQNKRNAVPSEKAE